MFSVVMLNIQFWPKNVFVHKDDIHSKYIMDTGSTYVLLTASANMSSTCTHAFFCILKYMPKYIQQHMWPVFFLSEAGSMFIIERWGSLWQALAGLARLWAAAGAAMAAAQSGLAGFSGKTSAIWVQAVKETRPKLALIYAQLCSSTVALASLVSSNFTL